MKSVREEPLLELTAAIMHAAGSHHAEARTIARRLVDSNLAGHDSHGVIRVKTYCEWVRVGWLVPNRAPTLVFDSDALAIVEGNRGFGQVVGEFAVDVGVAQGRAQPASRWSACATADTSAGSATGRSVPQRRGRCRCIS